MDINLELYKIFFYVAKTGSFSEAAQNLFITQPAVSQAVKNLEKAIGMQLFIRNVRGVRLTNEGEMLFTHIEQAFHFIQSAENKLANMKGLSIGEIHIGASDTICRYYLLSYLEKFHHMYPGIKIHVTNRTSPQTIELLKKGRVDLGIVMLPVDDSSICAREVSTIQDTFIAGRRYASLQSKTLTLAELASYPLLVLERTSRTRKHLDEYFIRNGMELSPEIELGSVDLLVEFARIGLGISCVIRNFIGEEIKKGDLFEITLDQKIPERKLGIITLKNIPLTPAAERFIGLLE